MIKPVDKRVDADANIVTESRKKKDKKNKKDKKEKKNKKDKKDKKDKKGSKKEKKDKKSKKCRTGNDRASDSEYDSDKFSHLQQRESFSLWINDKDGKNVSFCCLARHLFCHFKFFCYLF